MQERNPLLVLVAGPYRSGTDDDPAKMAANHRAMNEAALEVFRAGHLPVTGEALALPLIELAGADRLRRDLPSHRAPARQPLRRRAADRRPVAGRRRDGRDRAGARRGRLHGSRPAAVMLKQERHRRILDLLAAEGRVVATDLQEVLGVSGYTVRRDLDELATERKLQRVHGGALRPLHGRAHLRGARPPRRSPASSPPRGPPPRCSSPARWRSSTAAARRSRSRTRSRRGHEGTFVTHSPPVATALAASRARGDPDRRHARRARDGGHRRATLEGYAKITADILFLGVWALHAEHGISGGYHEESEVRRALLQRADRTSGLASREKLGTVAPFHVGPATALTHLATDAPGGRDRAVRGAGRSRSSGEGAGPHPTRPALTSQLKSRRAAAALPAATRAS